MNYQEACATPSDIYEHLPLFAELAAGCQTIVELGTRSGVSTVAWLHGLPADGRLVSVDIDPAPPIDDPRWTFVQGDDTDPDIFDQLPEADLVFIDTSHHYQHTVTELNLYRWLVNPGGMIVLHDTELPHPEGAIGPPYPVKRAIAEFCAANGYEWSNLPNCWGIGIIKVPG